MTQIVYDSTIFDLVPRDDIVVTLKSMAHNYSNGHQWDHIDAAAALSAAYWLEQLNSEQKNSQPSEEKSVNELGKIQDYRFGSMLKGEHYAFARGLTINPTHLPQALDAMRADGWHLIAIFGQTNASDIGFVFERDAAQVPKDNHAARALAFELGLIQPEVAYLQERVDDLLRANNELVEQNRALKRGPARQSYSELEPGNP